MAVRAIFRSQNPAALTAGLLGATGVGLWFARSYYTNNAFAESPESPPVFSSWFGQSLRLGNSEIVNHNTKRLRFEFPNEDAKSGLVLTSAVLVMTWPKGKTFPTIRPYTPVSPLDQRGALELLVKKYPDGKASTYLHSLKPGDSLYFLGALKGHRWMPNKYPHVTLIAGGAGITPMYQLIQGILNNPSDQTKITLVFGVNSDADVLFRKEFEELERTFGERFKAVYTVSKPSVGSPFRKGYVTKELLEQVTGRAGEESRVFVCGPPAMEKALLGGSSFSKGKGGVLEELGYRKDQVHQF
ncbi:NADH-cytochrome b5 reductase-like protein [Cadophora sp. MPI-SDFR-AT-0126]|nr:NADH-cytochrome b5 reductase-like protein [Leotiomycetes sp. MPI-SDFR-AT-0126]